MGRGIGLMLAGSLALAACGTPPANTTGTDQGLRLQSTYLPPSSGLDAYNRSQIDTHPGPPLPIDPCRRCGPIGSPFFGFSPYYTPPIYTYGLGLPYPAYQFGIVPPPVWNLGLPYGASPLLSGGWIGGVPGSTALALGAGGWPGAFGGFGGGLW